MNTAILGVGTSRFGRQPERTESDLVWEAVGEALRDAEAARIDAVYLGSVFGDMGVAQRTLHGLGLTGIPIIRVENACASGTTALSEAEAGVASGRFGTALAVGVEHMTSRFKGAIPPESRDPEGRTGLALPALYAMAATRYEHVYGVTREQLALVAVKNRQHATNNPRAHFREAVTVDEVLSSRPIADPLTLLQCSPIADGAAAAVIGRPRPSRADVRLRGCVISSGELWGPGSPHVWGYDIVASAARRLYEEADIGPQDLDVLEVHDAFTIGEVVTTEALGLCEEGEGAGLVEQGATWLHGRTPVNPSGGLLARGHPLGCTGLAQVAELAWQLRGQAGPRQVANVQLGLVETMGGGVSGIDGNACVLVVLERPSN